MNSLDQTSCIILSAGSSGRMGRHKALLRFGAEKVTFIEKITQVYAEAGVPEILVVISLELKQQLDSIQLALPGNVRCVVNANPELGRFYSLKTGMQNTTAGNHVFFQNVDNPFVETELLSAMVTVSEQAEVVIPQFSGKTGHPVLLNPDVSEAIQNFENIDIRIDDFLRSFRIVLVNTENPKTLVNINSRLDYDKEFPELS